MHDHQETFDTDVLSLSGLEELELTFRDFHESSETGMAMIGLMSPGKMHDVDNVNDDDFYILIKMT